MPDLIAVLIVLTLVVGSIVVASHWFEPLQAQNRDIDLSLLTLPRAAFLSITRILVAYLISLFFAIAIGYWAAYSAKAERIIIPLVDILQSVPTLGFLPGTVLVFISIFPTTSIGLELSAILMIVVSMLWNMLLGFYASIKSIPPSYREVIHAYGYSRLGTLLRLEIPFGINALAWNSMLSVAGGWFFLTICESFTLGSYSFRLIGIGSYMAVAAERGDMMAIAAGTIVMIATLLAADFLIWQPLLRWSERFQRTAADEEDNDEESGVVSFFASSRRITRFVRRLRRTYSDYFRNDGQRSRTRRIASRSARTVYPLLLLALGIFFAWGFIRSIMMVWGIPQSEWLTLGRDAVYTTLRVMGCLLLSSIIMIPIGLWLGSQPSLRRKLRAVIQVAAGFPAPMIFPVLTGMILWMKMPLAIGSVFLMMFGAQWYLLFNVIAGTSSVPREFVEVARTTGMSRMDILRRVYLPATAPYIVTGLLTAAGGAWNASIVAEIVYFRGATYAAPGLGSYIAVAAGDQKYAELIAAVTVMVVLIIFLNRFIWARLYRAVEVRVQQ